MPISDAIRMLPIVKQDFGPLRERANLSEPQEQVVILRMRIVRPVAPDLQHRRCANYRRRVADAAPPAREVGRIYRIVFEFLTEEFRNRPAFRIDEHYSRAK